jgi:hypothetical protein
MRIAVTFAVLLAVVATALVAVCQHSETRRLQYRVWQLERRSERLERTRHRLTLAIEATRTPRRLLTDLDGGLPDLAARDDPAAPAPERGGGAVFEVVPGFEPGRNFEAPR